MSKALSLLPGELPMPEAPKVALEDGINCIPQHYLTYQHSLHSVQHIASFLDFDPAYLFFVDEDNSGIYIQIGIIGADNYTPYTEQEPKIVYGRKWRIESNQPSSEVIQTAFLAVQKAREHEIRELIKWRHNDVVTTPFSCHHDLPLMAMSKNTHVESKHHEVNESEIEHLLSQIEYDRARLTLHNIVTLSNGETIIEVTLKPSDKTHLPELANNIHINIMCESLSLDKVLYALVDGLITLSNRMVEENFTFKDFPRFSRANSIVSIAELSAKTRYLGHMSNIDGFESTLTMANYETDLARVPVMPKGALGDKIKSQMAAFKITKGIMPRVDKT